MRIFLTTFATCALILLFFTTAPAISKEIGGVKLPDTMELAGKTLKLNGAGLRSKFFFKIFAGGLYLESSVHDGKTVINADSPMLIRLHFIFDGLSPEKLQNGWKEGFELTAPGAEGKLKQAITTYVSLFSDEINENDIYDISWQPGHGLDIIHNGTLLGTINLLDFKKSLYAIWLGDEPVDDDLKEGLLGR
jgi:hypothetical protein